MREERDEKRRLEEEKKQNINATGLETEIGDGGIKNEIKMKQPGKILSVRKKMKLKQKEKLIARRKVFKKK